MLSQTFLKLFPPPKFLNIPYAGLDISDDEVRCIEYSGTSRGLTIRRYGVKSLPPGVIVGGEIQKAEALSEVISDLAKELKVNVVKASLPEEKMYLFKTEVPSADRKEIRQNIDFKLEENVPLSSDESIFFFNLIPNTVVRASGAGSLVSVSVAPRNLIASYLDAIKACGITVLSFEIQAKAIARSLIPYDSKETVIIIHIMERKTGVYIVCAGAVCFTSTIQWGNRQIRDAKAGPAAFADLKKQIQQVENYWAEHGLGTTVSRIIFSGRGSLSEGLVSECIPDSAVRAEVGNVWLNAFSHDDYIPPIPYEDSLDYAVAAGLALPSQSY